MITSGNHIWDKKEIFDYLPRKPRLLRPANYPADLPGSGLLVTKARNGVPVAVIDLQGRVHLPAIEDPFRMADSILKSLDPAGEGAVRRFSRRTDQREDGHGLVSGRPRIRDGRARTPTSRPPMNAS